MDRSLTFVVAVETRRVIIDEQDEAISYKPSLDGSVDSPNYSDAEDHSWHLPYASNGETYDEYDYSNASEPKIIGVLDLTRHSASNSSNVDLEKGLEGLNVVNLNTHPDLCRHLDRTGSHSENEYKICHLALETNQEVGTSIMLGCAYKDDLTTAHK